MSRPVAHIVTALLLLPGGPAAAETFYNKDGVLMSATAVAIHPGAAICRIREERHTAEQYEKLKPNEGQPLDVWRVELVVANYSGRALDYLNAHLNVTSDWPPCDHWDGPAGSYGAPVVWTGPLMSIQDVGIVEPGEEVRETAFVLAWHEEEPALGRWNINYDFAAAPPDGSGATETRAESAGTGRATAAARAREAAGTAEVPVAGGSGLPAGIRPEDTCPGKEVASSCWMELSNRPGCYTWNPNLQREETVTWTGGCSNGRASGVGDRAWSYTDDEGEPASSSGTGELRDDKEAGLWTTRLASGLVAEGSWVDGRPHGHHVLRWPSGRVHEGPYVDGKENGHWIERYSLFGTHWVEEGPYVDGRKHGHWRERADDGRVIEGPYVNGRKHGFWADSVDPDDFRECYWDGESRGYPTTCPP